MLVGALVIVVGAALVVLLARWLRTVPAVQEFLVRYPGEYPLPAGAPVGLPTWLGWQHFFNLFLMVLLVRAGWQIRTETRPALWWTSRRDGRRHSLTVWLHQALDLLWLVNGLAYAVLLFATGQWVRIVPTSWAVFPNAVSSALQTASLDWPVENGWVNYNGLQQLAYFSTVFVAAPLAVASGVRLSSLWPENERLNRWYPIGVARRVHFPVMLFFVAFTVAHVAMVLATDALRNLNHAFAASDQVNWVGFGVFVAALLVIAGAWLAMRPILVAQVARRFGDVSDR